MRVNVNKTLANIVLNVDMKDYSVTNRWLQSADPLVKKRFCSWSAGKNLILSCLVGKLKEEQR